MDSGRGRRGFTPHVFDQSKSGSAPQDLTKESLNKRSTTADSRVSQLLVVFYYDFADAHLTFGYFGKVHITDKISRCSGLEEALK